MRVEWSYNQWRQEKKIMCKTSAEYRSSHLSIIYMEIVCVLTGLVCLLIVLGEAGQRHCTNTIVNLLKYHEDSETCHIEMVIGSILGGY